MTLKIFFSAFKWVTIIKQLISPVAVLTTKPTEKLINLETTQVALLGEISLLDMSKRQKRLIFQTTQISSFEVVWRHTHYITTCRLYQSIGCRIGNHRSTISVRIHRTRHWSVDRKGVNSHGLPIHEIISFLHNWTSYGMCCGRLVKVLDASGQWHPASVPKLAKPPCASPTTMRYKPMGEHWTMGQYFQALHWAPS